MMLLGLFTISAYGATHQPTVLYTFECSGNAELRIGSCFQGGRPDSLILASDGNFYGTAQVSTEGTSAPNGGTVFSLTPAGTVKVLHTFAAGSTKTYPNGNLPGLLVEGPDGKLYGEAIYGGVDGCNGYCGYGVLFRINRDGTDFQVVHRFCSQTNCADGEFAGALVIGTDGNIYGAGATGSAICTPGAACGVIFRVTPSTGAYQVVFNFNSTTGTLDSGTLIIASDGTIWGTSITTQGEMLFHYTEATGTMEAFPMYFPQFNGLPSSGTVAVQGLNGNFYGTYGIYGESGRGIFEVDPNGSNLTLLPFFTSQDGGGDPLMMLLASDGNFYIDEYNGTTGYGAIAEVSPSTGQIIQTLSPFGANAPVGAYPAGIFQGSDGTFWGTTFQYGKTSKGKFADGTVFNLNLGLPQR